MWLMMQQGEVDDYIIATGEMHSVREFVERVFVKLNLDWRKYVEINSRYFRPTEVEALQGNAEKAKSKLGWKPKVTFEELIDRMVSHDLKLARQERVLKDAGHVVAVRGILNV